MKKILVLFGVLVLVPALSYAYINESEVSDIDTLKAQGFSKSTLEVVDTARYYNTGKNRKYQRYYQTKEHKYLGKAYKYIKDYIDPIQDDGIFGEHQVNYTNNWNGDVTRYSTEHVETRGGVDNL